MMCVLHIIPTQGVILFSIFLSFFLSFKVRVVYLIHFQRFVNCAQSKLV